MHVWTAHASERIPVFCDAARMRGWHTVTFSVLGEPVITVCEGRPYGYKAGIWGPKKSQRIGTFGVGKTLKDTDNPRIMNIHLTTAQSYYNSAEKKGLATRPRTYDHPTDA